MNVVCTWNIQGKRYDISRKRSNFTEALNACETAGGSLATFLTKDHYETFVTLGENSCGRGFWIGLVNRGRCSVNNESSPYQWVGSNKCISAAPLDIKKPKKITSGKCRGIIIRLYGRQGQLPMAWERDCNVRPRGYVCQFPIINETLKTSSKNRPTSAIPTSPNLMQNYNNATSINLPTSSISPATVSAVIVTTLFFFLLLACLWKSKKINWTQLKSAFQKRSSAIAPSDLHPTDANQNQDLHNYQE